jgi:hypothetical protein
VRGCESLVANCKSCALQIASSCCDFQLEQSSFLHYHNIRNPHPLILAAILLSPPSPLTHPSSHFALSTQPTPSYQQPFALSTPSFQQSVSHSLHSAHTLIPAAISVNTVAHTLISAAARSLTHLISPPSSSPHYHLSCCSSRLILSLRCLRSAIHQGTNK